MTAIQELQGNVLRHVSAPITHTAINGLSLYHADSDLPRGAQLIYKPMICLIAQGEKRVILGDTQLRYTTEDYLISSVDLPVTGMVCNAAPGRPYLSLSLAIDIPLLAGLIADMPAAPADPEPHRGLALGKLDPSLLDCFVRLTRLLDTPASAGLLTPLVEREILIRLLSGEQAQMLRQVASRESRTAQVARVIRWLRDHYARPFSIRTLCDIANMSPASLHRHFRAVTAMSPLQYQKQVRLQEARRLLLATGENAADAAFHVGYASPSQFSREYSRAFGRSPRADAAYLQQNEAIAIP